MIAPTGTDEPLRLLVADRSLAFAEALSQLLRDRHARRMRQAITRPRHELFEHIIWIQRQRLIALIEHAALGDVLAVKAHRDQPSRRRLRSLRKGLLALALAEVELGRGRDGDLDDAVGQLPRRHLIEPDAVEARVMHANAGKNALPQAWIKWMLRGTA